MTLDRTHIQMRTLARDLLVCLAMAAIFAFLGVYDSDSMAWPARMTFWSVIMCLGGLFVCVIEPLVFGKLLKSHHPITQIIAIAAIISIPIAIFLVGLNTQFEFDWSFSNWVLQYASVILISLIIVAGRYLITRLIGLGQSSEQSSAIFDDEEQRFLERLPVKFRSAKLIALSSEGHYLRVHTDGGSTLILMRISDAVRELEGSDGLQVHRSWWVAREGVKETKRVNGRRFLVLSNDVSAPVSRSFLPALKAANLDR